MTYFSDHFSKQSSTYAKARPRYPLDLFQWLARQIESHQLAWDCATGNGQAALSLTEHFDQVVATDASVEQIANAFPHPRITYRVSQAHDSGLEDASVDLTTVATALHWLEQEKFYAEADRVLKPGGVLAVWSYAGTHVTPEIDAVLDRFAFETLRDYWPDGARKNWIGRYKDVALPFQKVESPQFYCHEEWRFEQLLSYLNSWSGVQAFKEKHSENPTDAIAAELHSAWGEVATRALKWELWLKVGRKL